MTPLYSYRLDDAEIRRYRGMADAALDQERDAWEAAGIGPGAHVVDLGCGPGAFLPLLVEWTSPDGRVTGVDRSADAVQAAKELLVHLRLDAAAAVVQAECASTGLTPASADVAFLRNVLIHNGPSAAEILEHVRSLLRPRGRALIAEPDVDALELPADAPDEQDLERRWCDWAASAGNDPALGAHLSQVASLGGFDVVLALDHVDTLHVERSPAFTARHVIAAAGFATAADVRRWEDAVAQRLAAGRHLTVRLPVHVVVVTPRS